MKTKIINLFKGVINDIVIKNERIYDTTQFVLETLEDKFPDNKYTNDKEFTKIIISTIDDLIYEYEYDTSLSDIEDAFFSSVEQSDTFEEIKLNNTVKLFTQVNILGLEWEEVED